MNRLQQIFSENWAITRNDYDSFLSLLLPCLAAGNIEAAEALLHNSPAKAYATTPYLAREWELDADDLPRDSVAVLVLEGILYSWDTAWLERKLFAAINNPQIAGIVLYINGPGGMVSRLDVAAETIATSPKPIATYVAGTMASAHFWLGTAAHRTFIASPLCEVGSVGVMVTYTSYKDYFKKAGIDYREIYPDTADLKNEESRAIEDNNDEEPIKQKLEILHRAFCNDVSRHIGVAYDVKDPLFRGKLFTGDVAVANGYIDQFGTLADAVKWVLAQSVLARSQEMNK